MIVSPQPEEARRVIVERCRESGVNPIWATENVYEPELNSGHTFRTEKDVYERVKLGLRGAHQLSNAATAIALAETLRSDHPAISRDTIIEGLQTARHAGRLEFSKACRRPRRICACFWTVRIIQPVQRRYVLTLTKPPRSGTRQSRSSSVLWPTSNSIKWPPRFSPQLLDSF